MATPAGNVQTDQKLALYPLDPSITNRWNGGRWQVSGKCFVCRGSLEKAETVAKIRNQTYYIHTRCNNPNIARSPMGPLNASATLPAPSPLLPVPLTVTLGGKIVKVVNIPPELISKAQVVGAAFQHKGRLATEAAEAKVRTPLVQGFRQLVLADELGLENVSEDTTKLFGDPTYSEFPLIKKIVAFETTLRNQIAWCCQNGIKLSPLKIIILMAHTLDDDGIGFAKTFLGAYIDRSNFTPKQIQTLGEVFDIYRVHPQQFCRDYPLPAWAKDWPSRPPENSLQWPLVARNPFSPEAQLDLDSLETINLMNDKCAQQLWSNEYSKLYRQKTSGIKAPNLDMLEVVDAMNFDNLEGQQRPRDFVRCIVTMIPEPKKFCYEVQQEKHLWAQLIFGAYAHKKQLSQKQILPLFKGLLEYLQAPESFNKLFILTQ